MSTILLKMKVKESLDRIRNKRRSPFIRDKSKLSTSNVNKCSTISFEMDVNIDSDDMRRIKSAHKNRKTYGMSVQKLKNVRTPNINSEFKQRKPHQRPATTFDPSYDEISRTLGKKRRLSSGVEFDHWCSKKEAELKLKQILLKKIKDELNKELSLQKLREDEINKIRKQNMKKWHASKNKEIAQKKHTKRSLTKKKKSEAKQKH